jgi:long-chain acyl-CoA synthetase
MTQTELTSFCRDRFASYKAPRRWEFRDDLPRTEAGKLYKRKIRDEYLAAMDTELAAQRSER